MAAHRRRGTDGSSNRFAGGIAPADANADAERSHREIGEFRELRFSPHEDKHGSTEVIIRGKRNAGGSVRRPKAARRTRTPER